MRAVSMVTVSKIFLLRMSSNSERIPNRGSFKLPPSTLFIFTKMCFRVAIDSCSMSAKPGLGSGSQTRMGRAIRNAGRIGLLLPGQPSRVNQKTQVLECKEFKPINSLQ